VQRDVAGTVPANLPDPTERRADGLPYGRRFQRGVSGNIKGRPGSLRGAVKELLGDHGERAIQELYRIASDRRLRGHNGAKVRLQAWVELLDRGFGKALLPMQVDERPNMVRFGGRYAPSGAVKEGEVTPSQVIRSSAPVAVEKVSTKSAPAPVAGSVGGEVAAEEAPYQMVGVVKHHLRAGEPASALRCVPILNYRGQLGFDWVPELSDWWMGLGGK
jgi:hypothetical protein